MGQRNVWLAGDKQNAEEARNTKRHDDRNANRYEREQHADDGDRK